MASCRLQIRGQEKGKVQPLIGLLQKIHIASRVVVQQQIVGKYVLSC